MTNFHSIILSLSCTALLFVGACQQEQTVHPSEDEQSEGPSSRGYRGYGYDGNFCESVCHEVCQQKVCVTKDKAACEFLDSESCQSRSDCNDILDGNQCQNVCDLYGTKKLYSCETKDIDYCESLTTAQCGLRSDCEQKGRLCALAISERGQLIREGETLDQCLLDCRRRF